ncbi:asparagine synthetase B [bacterium]|nr:asparagine synthetase B [bacterium]
MTRLLLVCACLCSLPAARAEYYLIPMDETQTDHLKAYGLMYWALQPPRSGMGEWLLNYRGGSFVIKNVADVTTRARLLGVRVQAITPARLDAIHREMAEANMDVAELDKAPKVAVYTPPGNDPWDDAVTLALEYAEIPYAKLWDPEVLQDQLPRYDWLHLHHEDFTGQYGKFYSSYANTSWYRRQVADFTKAAQEAGFASVAEHKRAVCVKIMDYIARGGFMFSMCAATDTFDIALAARGVDIVPPEIDGTPVTPNFRQKLDYSLTPAFKDFTPIVDAHVYEHSDIDANLPGRGSLKGYQGNEIALFEFSAKVDPVPTMLTQNHVNRVMDFLGQTSGFKKKFIKDRIVILGEIPGEDVAKYIYGEYGAGMFSYLAGHDPEDPQHIVYDKPTDLSLHKSSPGYRLILNNVLFPAAKKKERKT